MTVRIVAPVPYDEVMREFHAAHGLDKPHEENTNHDALKHMRMAQAQFGRWTRVLLDREEIRSVVLPWHESEGGSLTLVPRSGRTVAEAVELVRSTAGRFAIANPVCWKKLVHLRSAPLQGIYLSTEAIDDEVDYLELETRRGLIHLDGLHRLVSWELHGMLTDDTEVLACLAGAAAWRPTGG